MAQNDWPKVMYHTAIKHRYNVFGRRIEGFIHTGDLAAPNYPVPKDSERDTDAQSHGKIMGEHLIPQHHYRTQLIGIYNGGGVLDEAASNALVEKLKAEGWVTDPNELKEEYED